MIRTTSLDRLVTALCLISLALVLCGTNACQEDYDLGSRSSVPSATPTGDDDDDILTSTPTPTATVTITTTATPTVAPTDEGDDGGAAASQAGADDGDPETTEFFTELSLAGQKGSTKLPAPSNWLGRIGKDEADGQSSSDSDGDGFADWYESEVGSDPVNSGSTPPAPVTVLAARLAGVDDDQDGVLNVRERSIGTSSKAADSDGDGINDGAEVVSGTNPNDRESRPDDEDGDGLSADYERAAGLDPAVADSDGDGARDDIEVALHCDPAVADSDDDGILDGREIAAGSDPLRPERQRD